MAKMSGEYRIETGPGASPAPCPGQTGFFTGALVAVFCFTAAAAAAEGPAVNREGMDNTRAALEKWVETRRVMSREEQDWKIGREMLNERIGLIEREIESLHSKINDAEKNITEADTNRADLMEENEKLKAASASLNDTVTELESGIRALLPRLPDPIRERVKPLSQRLPENSGETKLSLSERFQNVVGVLNEVDKFNREITTTSEVRSLPNGTSAEVTALYIGISQGYYASANGETAGIGAASDTGWVWTPANEAAPQINEAVAILKNEKVACFVPLPVKIQ